MMMMKVKFLNLNHFFDCDIISLCSSLNIIDYFLIKQKRKNFNNMKISILIIFNEIRKNGYSHWTHLRNIEIYVNRYINK